ncbi:MAG TPA: NAD(P)H-quinone oxidoreductase [Ornithinimicrobium sp.]|uniref:NAD(P)H-quinone oxidoreductase n=1 Tax=Ornithinimicrobium sp. TaxID=1977084 RepID=UPI002B478DD5|nr:NAD(P)H-quinone oxidoreductase [Ornithinimicrobium sp.]HKJ11574.1 NAD(P)H-quinone oxidoreductase [Ornithinimicrobium sp.]
MRAVTLPEFGDADVLTVRDDVPPPQAGPREIVIDVVAAGVNRADVMQRMGVYPPPDGVSELPGLEVSGTVSRVGEAVSAWNPGDQVCALLAGGGYAEQVAVPAGQVLPVPSGVSLRDAAALPEVACTVWSNVVIEAGLSRGQTLLVHGGSSGIGTMAIQVGHALGATVVVTAGSTEKLRACRALGADAGINYRDEDFVERVQEITEGAGADVILDVVGAKYLDGNVRALAPGGRLVVIGLLGGVKGELNLARLLGKRGRISATSLRARSTPEKAAIVGAVRERVWPLIEAGTVRPLVHATYPLEQVAQAHRAMEDSQHIGKILLTL